MLPLTSIERLYYHDSTPRFPNRINCRLLLSARIDEAKAQEACFWLSRRHNVLNWRVLRLNKRLFWDTANRRFENSSEHDDGNVSGANYDPCRPPKWFHVQDLNGPPAENPKVLEILGPDHFFEPCMIVRRWVDSAGSCLSDVWFTVPHSFCDGAGGVLVANDWLQIYDNLMKGKSPLQGLLRLDHDRFVHRNRLGLGRWKFLRQLPFQVIGLFGAFKFIFRKSARFDKDLTAKIRNSTESDDSGKTASASLGCWLEQGALESVEKMVERHGYNLNSRFLGAVFQAIHRWRLRNDPQADPADWLRIILPMNLREIEDRRMEAANKSSLVQIDRRGGIDPNDSDYYVSINREIGVILKYKLDRMFLIMIRVIARIPFLLPYVASNDKHRGIAIFTNLGQPFKRLEKGTELERLSLPIEIDFLAPLRHGTPFNFAVARYQGRLRITLHYDPYVVSEEQAAELLEIYQKIVSQLPESD